MENNKKSFFAKNLIALRKSKGLSQRDLAKLANISNRVVAYYETNNAIPPMDKLEKLAKALNVSIAVLIDPKKSGNEIFNLDTRAIKKIKLLEKLPPEDQRKVLDYIKALITQNEISKNKAS